MSGVSYSRVKGGLSMTPGTMRIRIRTRLIALLLAINIVPLVAILDDFFTIFPNGEYSYQTMQQSQFSIFAQGKSDCQRI